MFCNCSSLKEINFTNINTNNVIDMSYMFFGCSSLKELDLSIYYKNPNDKSNMFVGCPLFKKINLNKKKIKDICVFF